MITTIEQQMLKPVGKQVTFLYPAGEAHKYGILKDRVVITSATETTGVPYWDVVDLIEFPAEPEPLWIRIGYYRKPKDHLVWGSQTTITEPVSVWKNLLVQAAREKTWFCQLLREAVAELEAAEQVKPGQFNRALP